MRAMRSLTHVLGLVSISVAFSGCGGDGDLEDYGTGSSAIVLSSAEQHPGGYGRKDCLVCHNAALNLHRESGSPIDVEALNNAVRANGESTFCLKCHGTNGL